jgi:uncharacterized protein (UPF0332 family)
MLDKERIDEAQKNVASYQEDGMLWKVTSSQQAVKDTYERNYKESLEAANRLFELNISSLWVVVCSYCSMFYIANAVLYKLGYKVGSKVAHKVTSDALVVLVREKLKKSMLEEYEEAKEDALEIIGRKSDELISNFDKELGKRSIFQYETTEEIKMAKAKTSLERAKKFIFEMRKLL